jgi:hypothetical protein
MLQRAYNVASSRAADIEKLTTLPRSARPRCCAITLKGTPCQAQAMANGLRYLHNGLPPCLGLCRFCFARTAGSSAYKAMLRGRLAEKSCAVLFSSNMRHVARIVRAEQPKHRQ